MIYMNFRTLLNNLLPRISQFRSMVILSLTSKCISHRNLNQTAANYSADVKPKIQNIFEDQEFEKDIEIPIHFRNVSTSPNTLYAINQNTAKEFTSLIIEDLSKNMKFVAEINPGYGLLTKELLKAGVPYIHLYEGNSIFHRVLNNLIKRFPNQLDLRKRNMLTLSKLLYLDDKILTSTVPDLFKGIERKKWEDESPLQLIGAINSTAFMRHLLLSVMNLNGLVIYGRPTLYFAISPSLWHTCTSTNTKRTVMNFMYRMFFDFKLLGTLDRTSYVPRQKPKKTIPSNTEGFEDDKVLCVIRMEPKADVFKGRFTKDDIIPLWNFVLLKRKEKRVIPALEKIVPGCGVRVIAQGYNVFTEFDDLTNTEMINLYYDFRSWPEYKKSSFVLTLQDNILKYTYCNVENTHLLNINID